MAESEMVERVARAMVGSWGGDPDTIETASSALPRPKMWELYAGQARAAIEAMREPTETMIAAGEPVVYDCYSSEPGEGLDENPAIPTWHAMIDAALNPPPRR